MKHDDMIFWTGEKAYTLDDPLATVYGLAAGLAISIPIWTIIGMILYWCIRW